MQVVAASAPLNPQASTSTTLEARRWPAGAATWITCICTTHPPIPKVGSTPTHDGSRCDRKTERVLIMSCGCWAASDASSHDMSGMSHDMGMMLSYFVWRPSYSGPLLFSFADVSTTRGYVLFAVALAL